MIGQISESITLDWLSFTIESGIEGRELLKNRLGKVGQKEENYGMLGYTSSVHILDGGRILWNIDREEMGTHVILNAASLALADFTAIGLLNWVIDLGGEVKRLDIAFDDFDGLLVPDEMYRKILTGAVQTRFRRATRIDGADLVKKQKSGYTINLGRRSSESFIRIYDKKLERQAKGEDVGEIENWVRVEIEIKGKKAIAFAEMLVKHNLHEFGRTSAELCSSLLLGLLDFKIVDPFDSNKSRWPTAEWWLKFVGVQSKLTLSIPKIEKTMEGTKRWIKVQVATSLALIVLSHDSDDGESGYEFVMNCVLSGADRLSKKQIMILDAYNAKFEAKTAKTDIPDG